MNVTAQSASHFTPGRSVQLNTISISMETIQPRCNKCANNQGSIDWESDVLATAPLRSHYQNVYEYYVARTRPDYPITQFINLLSTLLRTVTSCSLHKWFIVDWLTTVTSGTVGQS